MNEDKSIFELAAHQFSMKDFYTFLVEVSKWFPQGIWVGHDYTPIVPKKPKPGDLRVWFIINYPNAKPFYFYVYTVHEGLILLEILTQWTLGWKDLFSTSAGGLSVYNGQTEAWSSWWDLDGDDENEYDPYTGNKFIWDDLESDEKIPEGAFCDNNWDPEDYV